MMGLIKNLDLTKRLLLTFCDNVAKKHGTTIEELEKGLRHSSDPVVRALWEVTQSTSEHMGTRDPRKWHQRAFRTPRTIFLGIFFKDTAYHDPGIHMLHALLSRADELLPILEARVRDPADWYINTWQESKEHTAALRTITDSPHTVSRSEEVFFDTYHELDLRHAQQADADGAAE